MLKKIHLLTYLFLCISVLFITGCAAISKDIAKASLKLERYRIDYSTGSTTGNLVLYCEPLSQQGFIGNYILKIDDNKPTRLFVYSITDITLDVGTHDLEIYAIPEGMKFLYGESFGKKTKERIAIETGERITYEYTGPFTCFSKGVFKKLKSE